MSLPRFGGGMKRGIYSTEGGEYGQATENLHTGVQTGSGGLVKSSGKPMSQIARDLGVSDSALYHWSKQLANQGEQAFPGSGHQTVAPNLLNREFSATAPNSKVLSAMNNERSKFPRSLTPLKRVKVTSQRNTRKE